MHAHTERPHTDTFIGTYTNTDTHKHTQRAHTETHTHTETQSHRDTHNRLGTSETEMLCPQLFMCD